MTGRLFTGAFPVFCGIGDRMGDFVLVTEEGTRNFKFAYFGDESSARRKAALLWCCWVLFKKEGAALTELTSGGVGFACASIRKHATVTIKENARNEDARAHAAAAAEARMAAAAASKPKPKPEPAAPLGGRDGKPDVSNPVTWE